MNSVPTEYYIRVLPEIVLTVFGAIIMLISGPARQGRRSPVAAFLAFVGCLVALVSVFFEAQQRGDAFSGMIRADNFAIFFHLVIIGATAVIVLLSMDYLRVQELERGEFYALLLFGTVGMCFMVASADLIMMFISLEISSIATYVLAGFRRDAPRSAEASLKYLLLGSFATAFFLYGIALVYGASGATNVYSIAHELPSSISVQAPAAPTVQTSKTQAVVWHQRVSQGTEGQLGSAQSTAIQMETAPPQRPEVPRGTGGADPSTHMRLILVAAALMFIGLGFKVSAAPFHVWTPDVYEGAPVAVTAFMSAGPKAAAFAIALRIFQIALHSNSTTWFWIVWITALLSMCIGNVAALLQRNLKRMLAYSSIAHAGYVLVAFAAASDIGVSAVLFYLAAYVAMNIGAFAVIAHFAQREERDVELDDYAGLGFRYPLLGVCLCVFLFSLIGVPLTGGFFGKLYVFRAALDSHLVGLTVIGVLNSALAAYYYLRVIVYMYMRPPEREFRRPEASGAFAAVMLACVAAVIWLGIFPGGVLDFVRNAAQTLR